MTTSSIYCSIVSNPSALAVAQAATPLAAHTARFRSLLTQPGAVEDEHAIGMAEFFADVLPQFLEHGLIVPAAGADEQLQGPAFQADLMGDRLGRLPLQAGEFAL